MNRAGVARVADLPPLPNGQAITDPKTGQPTLSFTVYWQQLIGQITLSLTDITNILNDILAAQAAAVAAAREAARLSSYTQPSSVLTAADVGTTATVTVAAHLRVYPVQGTIDVLDIMIAAGSISGLAFSTTYYVYYDDTTLANTAPGFIATTSLGSASVGAAQGRHFLGKIITPADGAGNTTGTGGLPPGGGGGDYIT